MRYFSSLLVFIFLCKTSVAQHTLGPLSVEKIMKDPAWIGTSPSNLNWSADGTTLYFNWNPENAPSDSLYAITIQSTQPKKVARADRKSIVYDKDVTYNLARTQYTYAKEGDIYLVDIKSGKTTRVTETADSEYNPDFSFNGQKLMFQRSSDLFAWDLRTGQLQQLISFQKANPEKSGDDKKNEQEQWLKKDQLEQMEVLKERQSKKDATEAYNKADAEKKGVKTVYFGDKSVRNVSVSADGRFISYLLYKTDNSAKRTIVPDYVTISGFTEDIPARTKVGTPSGKTTLFLYDRQKDTVYLVNSDSIPGYADQPDYAKDYPAKKRPRIINVNRVSWSPTGVAAMVELGASDNKDRWIMQVDTSNGKLVLVDRQRDEAWIGGPGISSYGSNTGWINGTQYWFQSEASGYSHLYVYDVENNQKKALTQGRYEVQTVQLAANRKHFYITTNEVHAGEKQFYRLPVAGGTAERLTSLPGANQAVLSPDEKRFAYLYSYTNKPWELYLQETKPGAKATQITNKAASALFQSYPWRDPELVMVPAADGNKIPSRLYRPANPDPTKPAVIFVHGAGYLQNAHKWWSSYFREYMFHNMLADQGYVVLDMDYRGSAGYGRDWRTGIYRHMGGKDLTDHIDGARYLTRELGVDSTRIGIYGGSYGGFITLMALFTTPGKFAAGAALRPVTDWAHYNHGYTANILNTPAEDSIAYRRSSPIYFADGLQDHLLICHGVVDVNVHFQDVVRLNQRLIELGKDNWQVAMYPVEDHGFVEPSSWTDEYKRIAALFDRVLKAKRP